MKNGLTGALGAILLLGAAPPSQAVDPPPTYGASPPPGWSSPYGVPAWGGRPFGGSTPYATQPTQPGFGGLPPPVGWPSPYGSQAPAQPGYGSAPGTAPGVTTYAPYIPLQPQAADTKPPRVELQLSDPAPYVQQSVILTLRLVSTGGLTEATPELPDGGPALLRVLDGPRASIRQQGAAREIVNEFRFVLTPLEDGDHVLPGLRVRGSQTGTVGGYARAFDVRSDPLTLSIRPAASDAPVWLPLYHLTMRGYVTGDDQPAAGKPIGLTVEMAAVGATGGQLPTAEAALRTATDFSIYLEATDIESGTTPDGRFLTGRRLERYTLVPRYGGKLHVPAVRVPWFNLSLGRQEATELPIRQVVAAGPQPPQDPLRFQGGDIVPTGHAGWLFWTPLFLLIPVLLGYAVMLFSPPPPLTAATAPATAGREPGRVAGWLGRVRSTLSPWRLAEWLRPRIASALPVAARLWFCLRIVEREDDPEDWAMLLKFLSAKHLGISAQLPLPALGEEIVRHAARRADATRVRELMVQLDDALYGGGKPIADFAAWKRAFRRETRPRLFAWRPRGGLRRHDLPALNPSGEV